MKIAFVVNEFPKLSETFVLRQIVDLIEAGHEVEIFANARSRDPKEQPVVSEMGILRRCYYFDIPDNRVRRLTKALNVLCAGILRRPKQILRSFNAIRYGRLALSLRLPLMVAMLPKARRYDVIYCHFGPNGVIGEALRDVGALSGRVVTVFHGFDLSSYVRQHGRRIYRSLFDRGDLFLPVSNYYAKKLVDLGCDPTKVIVHRMGIQCDDYPSRVTTGDSNYVRFVSVARLVEKKGIAYALEALSRISQQRFNFEYIIVGDGPLRGELESLAAKLNISQNVRFVGWKTGEEVVDLVSKCDIFLGLSVTSKNGDQEGIPVALMEAAMMGLPVIATLHSGIPELVEDGSSGYLVPERDVEATTEAILKLINERESWEYMGRRGALVVRLSLIHI